MAQPNISAATKNKYLEFAYIKAFKKERNPKKRKILYERLFLFYFKKETSLTLRKR